MAGLNPLTYRIPGMALMNQRVEVSNANDDCVFTSCACIVRALTTTHPTITGSDIKAMDNDYGPKYVGFASAANLVDTLDKLGVTLTRVSSDTQVGLVALLRAQVAAGHPCLVTMPSQWNSAPRASSYNPRAYRGYSHVGVACGTGNDVIRVMNPWGGFWQFGDNAYWALRLLTGAIWVASKKPVAVVVPAAAAKPVATATTTTTAALSDAEKLAAIAKILNG